MSDANNAAVLQVTGYSFSDVNRWLVVDNVAFSVLTLPEPSGADRAWLASLEAALRARH